MAYGRAFDALSVSLQDQDLQEELDLLIDLVLAANESDGPLPTDVIDRLLGVGHPTIVAQRGPAEPVPTGGDRARAGGVLASAT